MYLRNTHKICAQHAEALSEAHEVMASIARATTGMEVVSHVQGVLDESMTDLEDED